jgi:hypothetical protein
MPRAGRPVNTRVSAVSSSHAARQRRPVRGHQPRFRTEQIRRADLHGRRAEHKRGDYAASVGDAAGGDHWYLDGVDHLRDERHGADLPVGVPGKKDAAMAAGLEALGYDRVTAMFLQPDCLAHRGGGGDHLRACGLHARDQRFGRQAEMEAHDLGP